MTVLLVITVPEPGGAQRHVRDLMAGLRGRVRFLLATSGAGWLVDEARCLGIPVIPLEFDRTRPGWRDLMVMWRLADVIRKERVTLVHCHSFKAAVLGRLAGLLARRPSLYTVHGFAFKDRRFPRIARIGFLAIEWILGKITTRLINTNRADFDSAFRLRIIPYSRLDYVPNGVSVPERAPDVRPAARGTIVGTMTRLIKGKGVSELLEAIWLLLPSHPDIKLRIAGDGPWRSILEARARQLGLQAQAQFLGWVEDVDCFLAGIDIFVLSSWKESAPYALLDAMAHGKAIVTTDVGGMPEMLRHGAAGLLVSPGDTKALAESISLLVAYPECGYQMGSVAQSTVRERFRLEEMLQKTYAVYSKVSLAGNGTVNFSDDSGAEPDAISRAPASANS